MMSVLIDPLPRCIPMSLSGGMKQRVVIAMSLLLDPDILIADEPTTALDVLVQAQIIKLLKSVKIKRGISIIIISHDLGVISEQLTRLQLCILARLSNLQIVKTYLVIPNTPIHNY